MPLFAPSVSREETGEAVLVISPPESPRKSQDKHKSGILIPDDATKVTAKGLNRSHFVQTVHRFLEKRGIDTLVNQIIFQILYKKSIDQSIQLLILNNLPFKKHSKLL
ncbi:hypothetical protein [Pararhodospirillum oryzae]|uniref:hypothetical protein n=1 Tax=Pararhodospirillum oryzae TaxID=478448 RepID=UPI0011BFAE8F|nr:hypothetical protein [Pararhodospirillum oryzae]